ncbi:hypothetical protein EI94DRAFT_1820977 [Lactarius quietus]|nr:hypothetical protein EI94DRAFT_1820977 [Lactarius quietus]
MAKIEKQKQVRLLMMKAVLASRCHAKWSQVHFNRLDFIQPNKLHGLHALAKDIGALHVNVSTLPLLEPVNTHSLLPGLGKREWEIGKAGYLNWANAQLMQHTKKAARSALESTSAEEARGVISNDDVSATMDLLPEPPSASQALIPISRPPPKPNTRDNAAVATAAAIATGVLPPSK